MAWIKGQSGNPGGRPRIVSHIRRQAQNHAEEHFGYIHRVAAGEEKPDPTRLAAARLALQIAGVAMTPDNGQSGDERPAADHHDLDAIEREVLDASRN